MQVKRDITSYSLGCHTHSLNQRHKQQVLAKTGETRTLTYCLWGYKMVKPLWKEKFGSSYDPAISLLGMYPREIETYAHTMPCTQHYSW